MTRQTCYRALPLSLFLTASALSSGCSTYVVDENSGGEESATGETGETSVGASASGTDGSDGGSDGSDGSDSATGAGTSGDSGDPSDGDSAGSTGGGGGDDTGESGGDTDGEVDPPEPGQLTAGEWRDLDHWQFWSDLLAKPDWNQYESVWNFFTSDRYAVIVEAQGAQIADAEVTLLAGQDVVWEARTDIRGRAELFSGLFGQDVEGPLTIAVNGTPMIEDAAPASADPHIVQLDDPAQPEQVLDLLFMVDTTGSMGDELSYLQAELADVIDEVRTKVGQDFKLRLSVNFYRDDGDEYLVRSFPFTEDVDLALSDLAKQDANGGGDYPEAVTEALDSAVADHEWSQSAVSRLAFLILDAPPHNTQDTVGTMNTRVKDAAAKGIRIIPVASSGVDKTTEFFLRYIDIATGGTYVFLTSDSGIGGEHLEPTIGDYQVEYLNDLLVRLIIDSAGAK